MRAHKVRLEDQKNALYSKIERRYGLTPKGIANNIKASIENIENQIKLARTVEKKFNKDGDMDRTKRILEFVELLTPDEAESVRGGDCPFLNLIYL